jgi:hypothetical protein
MLVSDDVKFNRAIFHILGKTAIVFCQFFLHANLFFVKNENKNFR